MNHLTENELRELIELVVHSHGSYLSTDKAIAKQMESLWRSQLIQSHQLGIKPSISITEAFQRYSNSKSDLSSHKALSRWCRRSTTYFNNHFLTNVHQITSRDI